MIKLNNTLELRSVTQCTSGSNIPCRPPFFKIMEQTCQVSRLCRGSHDSESHIFCLLGVCKFAGELDHFKFARCRGQFARRALCSFSAGSVYFKKPRILRHSCGLCKNIWVRFPYDPRHLLCMKQFHIFLTDS